MRKYFINLMIMVLFFAPAFAQEHVYQLNGWIRNGIKEGTAYVRYFYRDAANEDHMVRDSGTIKDGRFYLKGRLPGKPVIGKISLRDITQPEPAEENISEVYLEPAMIKLEATNNLLSPAFSGSASQREFSQLYASLKEVRAVLKRIDDEYGKAQEEKDLKKLDALTEELKTIYEKRQGVIGKFIKKHPSSFISAYKFGEFLGDEEIEVKTAQSVYDILSPDLKKLPVMQEMLNRISIARKTEPGNKAIDFTQADTSGNKISLSSFRGKYVLIDFWSSWCVPCRAENPALRAMYAKYKSKGFEIIGVSLDGGRKPWVRAIVADSLPWTQVSDLKVFGNEVAKMYGITAIPRNLLIDREGKIVSKNLRGLALERELKKYFKD